MRNFVSKFFITQKTYLVWVFFVFLLLGIFYPFLFQGKIFLDSDISVYYYSAFDFYHQALVSGDSFFWNPYVFSGLPMYLSQAGGFLDPLNLLIFRVFDGFLGLHIRLFFDYLLILIFSFSAARKYKLSTTAALLVGVSYIMAFNQTYASNPLFANSAFLLPFLVLITAKIREGVHVKRSVVFGGIGTGLALLGGYTQVVLMTLVLVFLFNVLSIYLQNKRFLQEGLRFFFTFCCVVAIGGLIALPFLVPALRFVSYTSRSGGLGASVALLKTIDIRDFVLFFFPDYLYFPYVSSGRKALFVGPALLLIAITYFVSSVRESKDRFSSSHALMWSSALTFVFALLLALKGSPLAFILQKVPIFSWFRFPDRWMYGGAFFLAFLGGQGLDAAEKWRGHLLSKRIITFVSSLFGIFFGSILLLNLSSDSLIHGVVERIQLQGPMVSSHHADAMTRGLIAWRSFCNITDVRFLFPTISIIVSLLVMYLYVCSYISLKIFRSTILSLTTVLCIFVFHMQFAAQLDRDLVLQATSSYKRFLAKEADSYRVYPFLVDFGLKAFIPPTYQLSTDQVVSVNELKFSSAWPNTNTHARVASVDGYDLFVPKNYLETLASMGSVFGAQDATRPLPVEKKVELLLKELDVLSMMSGRYILSGYPLQSPQLRKIGQLAVTKYGVPLYIFENKSALPRSYFAKNTLFVPHSNLQDLTVASEFQGFQLHTYVNCADCVGVKIAGATEISEQRRTNGALSAHVTVEDGDGAWFVFSETLLPGWHLSIDGEERPIRLVNGLYMGAFVPPGVHDVRFVYDGWWAFKI